MGTFISWLGAHWALISTIMVLILSEVLALTKGPLNGIIQGLITVLRSSGAKARKARKTARRAMLLLPIAFLGFLSGCSATWSAAFKASEKACQVANVPSLEQGALTQATAILADPVGWEAGLLSLGAQIGYEQVKCLVMAIAAGIAAAHPAPAPADMGPAASVAPAMTATEALVVQHANAWLAKMAARSAR